ncbi:SMC-Scp complex subunit ScpB [archaeon]|jgi:segregation and condensation protein B|nr:SMC-Scp complex subunit ScpB [archaeon]MBT4416544.1 SMC-Scp complex subunit ScpB [archaeon]
MQDIKNKVEAVLFITGKFMSYEEIANFCNLGSVGIVKDALKGLKGYYESKESGLDIFEENGKFKLNIRKNYNYLTTDLAAGTELDAPTQATLAIIAYKQPILQSDIIKMRGNTAYDHIKALKEKGFLGSEKKGRTRLLKLTPTFYDYFDVVEDTLKEKLQETKEIALEKHSFEEMKEEEKENRKEARREKRLQKRIETKPEIKDDWGIVVE